MPSGSPDRTRSLTRRRALALFGAAGSGALAGCAGGGDDGGDDTATETATPAATVTPTETPTSTATGTPTATSTPAPPDVADRFPRYEDPDTGLAVHQLTTGAGEAAVEDHQTGYYHHDPVYGDWVVTRTIAERGQRYHKTNVRTGERVPLADWNAMGGIQVRGSKLFTTRAADDGRWLASLDLESMTWTDRGVGTRGSSWRLSTALAVDPSARRVITRERQPDAGSEGPEHRTRLHDFRTDETTVLRTGEHLRNHYEFSPAGDGTFRAINEWIGEGAPFRYRTERFVVGTVDRGRGAPLQLEGAFWTADADDEGPHGAGYNMAHPFWAPDGRCHTDVVWHPDLAFGEFELVTFDFPSVEDLFEPVPRSRQTRRRYPGQYWSNHFNAAGTGDGHWYVGDGDTLGVFTRGGFGRTHVNAFRLLDGGDMVYVPLARVPRYVHASRTHVLPSGGGVVTVWKHDLRPDVEDRLNVFLVALPVRYQAATAGDDAALDSLLADGRAERVENRLD